MSMYYYYFCLFIFIILAILLLYVFLFFASVKDRKQAKLAAAIGPIALGGDFFAIGYILYFLNAIWWGEANFTKFIFAIASCIYFPVRVYFIRKELRPKPLLTREILKNKTERIVNVASFDRHKLVEAYIQLLSADPKPLDDLDAVIKEMIKRRLWDSRRSKLHVFLYQCDVKRSEVTLHFSEYFIAVESWFCSSVTIYRTDDILEFNLRSIPTIVIDGVTLGFKSEESNSRNQDLAVFYYPYEGIKCAMETISKLGFTIKDERKENDNSRDDFISQGIIIPQKHTTGDNKSGSKIDVLIDDDN